MQQRLLVVIPRVPWGPTAVAWDKCRVPYASSTGKIKLMFLRPEEVVVFLKMFVKFIHITTLNVKPASKIR